MVHGRHGMHHHHHHFHHTTGPQIGFVANGSSMGQPVAVYPVYSNPRISVSCITCNAITWPILLAVGLIFLISGATVLGLTGSVGMVPLVFFGCVFIFAGIFIAIYLSMQGNYANNTRAMFCACTKDGKKDLQEIAQQQEAAYQQFIQSQRVVVMPVAGAPAVQIPPPPPAQVQSITMPQTIQPPPAVQPPVYTQAQPQMNPPVQQDIQFVPM